MKIVEAEVKSGRMEGKTTEGVEGGKEVLVMDCVVKSSSSLVEVSDCRSVN